MSTSQAIVRRSPSSATELIAMQSAHSFPRHSHDQYGIGLICTGAQRSFSGRGMVDALAGDVIMVNPGEIHDGQPLHGEQRSWQMLYFEPWQLQEAAMQHGLGSPPLLHPISQDKCLTRHLQHLLQLLLRPASEPLALAQLVRFPRHAMAPVQARANLQLARQVLHDNSEQGVRLAELAATCELSPFQLLRQFQQQYGITPHAYLLQYRLQRARQLLKGPAPLADIALSCGFADQSHLTRAFRRQYGITPGRYRLATA